VASRTETLYLCSTQVYSRVTEQNSIDLQISYVLRLASERDRRCAPRHTVSQDNVEGIREVFQSSPVKSVHRASLK